MRELRSENELFRTKTQMGHETKIEDASSEPTVQSIIHSEAVIMNKYSLARFRGAVKEVMYKRKIQKLETFTEFREMFNKNLRAQLSTIRSRCRELEKTINKMENDSKVDSMKITSLEEQTITFMREREEFKTKIISLQEAMDAKAMSFGSMDDMSLANDIKFGPRCSLAPRESMAASVPNEFAGTGGGEVQHQVLQQVKMEVEDTDHFVADEVHQVFTNEWLQTELSKAEKISAELRMEVSSLQASLRDALCSEEKWRSFAQRSWWDTIITCTGFRTCKVEQATPMLNEPVNPAVTSIPR